MKRVLVCEDESNIREFVVINLKRAGYDTVEAGSGDEAMELYYREEGNFDIALLDIMLPGKLNGVDVCRELRRMSSTIGIIMLSAKTQEADKVGALTIGADDYVTKPFSPSELVARVEAVHRRVNLATEGRPGFSDEICSGDFVLNTRDRSLTKAGNAIELTQVEYQIMHYFITNPGVDLTRTDILHKIWGTGYSGEIKIVDVNIRRLRLKIEEDPSNPEHIITAWGVGYKWTP